MLEALLLLLCAILLIVIGPSWPLLIFFAIVLVLGAPVFYLTFTRSPPFLPTPIKRVRTMLELAGIGPGKRVYDLGCGDGRIVLTAAAMGAEAVGYELSLPMYFVSKLRTLKYKHCIIRFGNFWTKNYADADLVCCFLLRDAMARVAREIWPQLKPGAAIAAHMFQLPGVTPERVEGEVYLYRKR